MPRILILTFLLSLFLVTYGGPAHAQAPAEDTQEGAETPEAGTAPQPEVPKHVSTIIVEDNHLSVEFVDVNFGEIMRSISQKAKFMFEGSSPAFNKKVTTKFTDLDMDKGIVRLFSMVSESNYLISYNAQGSIAMVKIPSAKASGKTSSLSPGPTVGPQSEGVNRFRRRRQVFRRPVAPGTPAAAPEPEPPQPEETEEAPDE